MPLHPDVEKALKIMNENIPPLHTMPPQEARKLMEEMRGPTGEPEAVGKVENRKIPSVAGSQAVRIYTPEGDGPFPILVYFHGGGWVIGSPNTVDASCRAFSNLAQCIVVSSSYRLAPENKFPAAIDDCYAATRWAALNAAALNGDAGRIAVGGESAGANLAAAVALKAQEQGIPSLAYQLLMYPVVNHAFDTPSCQENAEGYFLTKDMMVWFWDQYLENDADGRNPLASPLQASDQLASQVPPAFIAAAEFDPLRDEAAAYAAKLKAAGVAVQYTCYEGLIHGFMGMAPAVEPARIAREEAGTALKAAFAE
jgi:acetyl esterase